MTESTNARARHYGDITLSLLSGCNDTRPTPHTDTWNSLVRFAERPQVRTRKDGPAFVAAEFGHTPNEKGSLRHDGNAVSVPAIPLDLDGKGVSYTDADLRRALAGLKFLAYTTFSSTRDEPRWRVVLPLAEPIRPWQLSAALNAVERLTGLRTDDRCRRPACLYYLPAVHPDRAADYQVIWGDGERLHPRGLQLPDSPPLAGGAVSRGADGGASGRRRFNLVERLVYSNNRSTKLNNPSAPRADGWVHDGEPLPMEEVIRLYAHRGVAAAVARHLNLPADAVAEVAAGRRASHSFKSPLPWRRDEHPSCVLLADEGKEWVLHDHGDERGKTYNLARYAMARDYKKPPAKGACRSLLPLYRVRLLVEAGVLKTLPVEDLPPCPNDVTCAVRKVYEGFRLLMECKNLVREWAGQPTVFAATFISAWCGVSYPTAHYARKKLTDLGLIGICGNAKGKRSPCVYAPGPHRKHPDARNRKPSRSERLKREREHRHLRHILALLEEERDPTVLTAADAAALGERARSCRALNPWQRFLVGFWCDEKQRKEERTHRGGRHHDRR
jgi:hypothetical protein